MYCVCIVCGLVNWASAASDSKARLSKNMKHFIKELHTIIKTNSQESDSTLAT